MRYGLVIDLGRCVGCSACTVACKQKNGTPPGVFWSQVLISESGSYPHTKINYLPILCMHCKDAPCVAACPTGATEKLANGIVRVDSDKCIGCRYCMAACAYSARSFNYGKSSSYYGEEGLTPFEQAKLDNHKVGVVEKCNLCLDRVEQGLDPMCVQSCPAHARYFGDLDDPNSEVSQLIVARGGYQLHPELGTDPSVYYLAG